MNNNITRRQFTTLLIGGIVTFVTANFQLHELECHCGCGEMGMDDDFLRQLQAIREEMNRPLRLSSALRCRAHNNKISEVKNGAHTVGKAVDILISGADAIRLIEVARKHGISGLGLQQKGEHGRRFCHIDSLSPNDAPRPAIWTYS